MNASKESSSHPRKQHHRQQRKRMRVVDDLDEDDDEYDEVEDNDIDALTYYPAEESTFDPDPTPSPMMSLDSMAFEASPTAMEIVTKPGRGGGRPRKKRAASSTTKPQTKRKYRRRQQGPSHGSDHINKFPIGFISFPQAPKVATRIGGGSVDVSLTGEPIDDVDLSNKNDEEDGATGTSIPLKKRLLHCVHPVSHAQVQV